MTRLSFLLIPGAPGHLPYPASLFNFEELDTNGLMSPLNTAIRLILIATEWERQMTTARANQTTGLTNGRVANWALEV